MVAPTSSTMFVGRARELAEIEQLLVGCRLLTLVGPGGIGKTQLALEAAARHQPAQSAYFIKLQSLTSAEPILSVIASTLGLQFSAGVEPKQQLLDYLREKEWLLVLDNFEHLLVGAMLLAEILAEAPNLRLLVTSRERLNLVEEWVFDVRGLAYPANERDTAAYSAIELFVQQASRAKFDFQLTESNRAAVGRICRLVGGMPLGIELAAHWVRVLSCEAIADELQRSLDILETPARNVEPRHRTMRAAFEPAWVRLTDDERSVFMRLAVFRGGFTREMAAGVAGASLRTLTALVDKSLVHINAANERYDLHELLRQYAEEQLHTAGEFAATKDVHSACIAEFLAQKWTPIRSYEQRETLDAIEREFENIRAAWGWMVEQQKYDELSLSVYTLWYFCDLRGRTSDALPLFMHAAESLRPLAGDPTIERVLGQMLTRSAWFYAWLWKHDEARALADEGLAILRRVGSPVDVALAYDSFCLLEAITGNGEALKRNAELEAEIARSLSDHWHVVRAAFPRANAAIALEDWEDAQQSAQVYRAAMKDCGDSWMGAMCCMVHMLIAERLHDYAQAKQEGEQGLTLLVGIRQGFYIGVQYLDLGWQEFCLHNHQNAARHYQTGMQLLLDTGGFLFYLVGALPLVAHLWLTRGMHEQALELVSCYRGFGGHLNTEAESESALERLKTKLPPQVFAAAWERGKQLEVKAVAKLLIVQLEAFIDEPVLAQVSAELLPEPLTKRELEILRLMAAGYSNGEIAEQLVIAVSTVKWYVKAIYSKLDASRRTQAVAYARSLGLVY